MYSYSVTSHYVTWHYVTWLYWRTNLLMVLLYFLISFSLLISELISVRCSYSHLSLSFLTLPNSFSTSWSLISNGFNWWDAAYKTTYIITMNEYIYHIDKHKDTYIINYICPHVYVDIYIYIYIYIYNILYSHMYINCKN